jgi:hypothetical protein
MQQAFEETLGSGTVPTVLHQNVQHDAVLIHRPPQIVQHTPDPDEHFVEVPGIPGPRTSSSQPARKVSTELQTPVPNAFVSHHDATLGQCHTAWLMISAGKRCRAYKTGSDVMPVPSPVRRLGTSPG